MPDGDFLSNPDDTHDDISLSQHDEEEAQVPVPKTWRSLFAKNRSKADNWNFWWFAGQQVVKLDVEDVKEEQQRWQHALVGSVLGPRPNFYKLRNFLSWQNLDIQVIELSSKACVKP